MDNRQVFSILSDPSRIRDVRKRVERFASSNGFSAEQAGQIGLAVNEAIANIIKHSYKGDKTGRIDIEVGMSQSEGTPAFEIVIVDYGEAVDPKCIKSRSLDEVRPGGLGVHIIKTVMDKVEYRCIPEKGMQLTMKKLLQATEESQNGNR